VCLVYLAFENYEIPKLHRCCQKMFIIQNLTFPPIRPITADHSGLAVFAHSNAGVRILLKALMSARLFCVCIVLCLGRGLATGRSPVRI
jgi:hypothetical protein